MYFYIHIIDISLWIQKDPSIIFAQYLKMYFRNHDTLKLHCVFFYEIHLPLSEYNTV